jgi:hypothetical protein
MPSSPEWDILLAPFASCFTRPGYRYFCAFVLVFAHLDGRLWVTQVVLSGFVDRHFTSFYRFLRDGAWTTEAVAERLWQQCQSVCVQAGGRIFVAVDDTVCRKRGEQFFGLGTHHDPMNRDHEKQLSRGHCFVCLAILGRIEQHAVALFVSCALYRQKAVCTDAQPFHTKLRLAAERLLALSVPEGGKVCAVADGAYAKRAFVLLLWENGRHVLSRLRSDAVFYDLPPARRKGQKGAPRKYGAKWKANEWANRTTGWRSITLSLYGQKTALSVKTRVVVLRSLGVKARLVAVRWDRKKKGAAKTVFLFSTDLALMPEEIVGVYCARFAIETGFRDGKQLFSLSTYQVRSQASILRIVHLCLWAQSLLRLRSWSQTSSEESVHEFGTWRKPLSYLTLGQQKRLSQHSFFMGSGVHTLNPTNPSRMKIAA